MNRVLLFVVCTLVGTMVSGYSTETCGFKQIKILYKVSASKSASVCSKASEINLKQLPKKSKDDLDAIILHMCSVPACTPYIEEMESLIPDCVLKAAIGVPAFNPKRLSDQINAACSKDNGDNSINDDSSNDVPVNGVSQDFNVQTDASSTDSDRESSSSDSNSSSEVPPPTLPRLEKSSFKGIIS